MGAFNDCRGNLIELIKESVPEITSVNKVEGFCNEFGVLIDQGCLFTTKEGNKLLLNGDEDYEIEIITIYAEPQGTGLGGRVVRAMEKYADKTMKPIRAYKVRNERFFKEMGFRLLDGEARYDPQYG